MAAATAAAAASAATGGIARRSRGAAGASRGENGKLDGGLFAGALGAGDFLLLVDDDFFEVRFALVANVFVDGHGLVCSFTRDREILPRSFPLAAKCSSTQAAAGRTDRASEPSLADAVFADGAIARDSPLDDAPQNQPLAERAEPPVVLRRANAETSRR